MSNPRNHPPPADQYLHHSNSTESSHAAPSHVPIDYSIPSAVPTLKVMRIQSPLLSKSQTPFIQPSSPYLSSSLILPDSFGVIHIGETFTAYLGAINVNDIYPVTNLSVSATLQTPTKRWPLPSKLENKVPSGNSPVHVHDGQGHSNSNASTSTSKNCTNHFQPMHIMPLSGVDAIISIPLEEVGQHILRVDVSYGGPDPHISLPQPSRDDHNNSLSHAAATNTAATPNQPSSIRGGDPNNSYNNSSNNIPNEQQPSYHPRKTLRKFYRFHVSSPLHMKELTLRSGTSSTTSSCTNPSGSDNINMDSSDTCCFVSLAVENAASADNCGSGGIGTAGGLTISQTEFQPFAGLVAKRIHTDSTNTSNDTSSSSSSTTTTTNSKKKKTAYELYDESGRLNPGESRRYLFSIQPASSPSTTILDDTTTNMAALRGIARGDELGKVVVTWRKAMGEAGRIASTFICCPKSLLEYKVDEYYEKQQQQQLKNRNHEHRLDIDTLLLQDGVTTTVSSTKTYHHQDDQLFIIHGSGLSIDVAANAAEQSAVSQSHAPSEISTMQTLDTIFPITVEPIDPPSKMKLGQPINVQLLVVNHGIIAQNLQLQMRLPSMRENKADGSIIVCGQSYINIGVVGAEGGSEVVNVSLMGLAPGLFYVKGCYVVNLDSGMEVKQPALFSVFVDDNEND